MNNHHRKTLAAIFDKPIRSDVAWEEVRSLFSALGAHMEEGRGSRVRVLLNQIPMVFHRPHPTNVLHKAALKSIRLFLEEAGVQPA